jgi:hypothetical protein
MEKRIINEIQRIGKNDIKGVNKSMSMISLIFIENFVLIPLLWKSLSVCKIVTTPKEKVQRDMSDFTTVFGTERTNVQVYKIWLMSLP